MRPGIAPSYQRSYPYLISLVVQAIVAGGGREAGQVMATDWGQNGIAPTVSHVLEDDAGSQQILASASAFGPYNALLGSRGTLSHLSDVFRVVTVSSSSLSSALPSEERIGTTCAGRAAGARGTESIP